MNRGTIQQLSIFDRIETAKILSTLLECVEAADLFEVLSDEGPFTLFAPYNSAFERLPQEFVDELLEPENQDSLIRLLNNHLIPEKIPSSQFAAKGLTTIGGASAKIAKSGDSFYYEGAKIIEKDIECSNGVIHIIDEVIIKE